MKKTNLSFTFLYSNTQKHNASQTVQSTYYESQSQQQHHWQTTSIQAWPKAPLVAYNMPPFAAKLQAQPEPAQTTLQPIYYPTPILSDTATYQQPAKLLLFNSPAPYYAAYSSLPYGVAAFTDFPTIPQTPEAEITTTTTTTTTSTVKPRIKDVEPTTARPNEAQPETLLKLQVKPQTTTTVMAKKVQSNKAAIGDLRTDARLLAAISTINPNYVIEDIVPIPGKHVLSTSNDLSNAQGREFSSKLIKPKSAKLKQAKQQSKPVKVEAKGSIRTSGNIPQIPFGTYFLPYYSRAQHIGGSTPRKQAALILEPHSKAVVGNGGTAISTPISKAYLKKGVPTNVYFNPESVAIAGVGGKAHAQADLELDLYN